MDHNERKMRGRQIVPGFGNWDYVNELPITQYFECARQAGLIRYRSSSSGECDNPNYNYNNTNTTTTTNYSGDYVKPRTAPPSNQAKNWEKRSGGRDVREGSRKQGAKKVFDVTVTEFPQPNNVANAKRHPTPAVSAVKKKQQQSQYDAGLGRAPKAVDEDLYKIPPELLKKKRRLGFFSRCLVPPCAV